MPFPFRLFFLMLLLVATPGLAQGADRVLLERMAVPQKGMSCVSGLQPVSAVPGAESSLLDTLSERDKGSGSASLGALLRQAGLLPLASQAVVAEHEGKALYLVPLASSEAGAAHIAFLSPDENPAAGFVLRMTAGKDGQGQQLALSTPDGAASFVLDLETGITWSEGLASFPDKAMADTLSCLWQAIRQGLPGPGVICALGSVVSTCVTNFSQCLGAVQGTLANIACATGVNVLVNALSCFSSRQDRLPPVIGSFSPSDQATVNSPFNLSCSASDTSGIRSINLLVEDTLVHSCNASPCSISHSVSAPLPDNRYRITCVALDQASNASSQIHTITVPNGGGSPGSNVLQNGVPRTGLSGPWLSTNVFRISVPAGRSRLQVRTFGGSGNVDLYLRRGSEPTLLSYDCRSTSLSNTETCNRNNPASGDWYIQLRTGLLSSYSGVTLVATY